MFLFLFGVLGSTAVSANLLELQEGDDCTPLGGGYGTCKLLSKCTTVGDFKNNHPPICCFKGRDFEPTICCPTKEVNAPIIQPGLKVQRVCSELKIACRAINEPKEIIILNAFNTKVCLLNSFIACLCSLNVLH
nr:clotting factor B [Halyomorpha halys]